MKDTIKILGLGGAGCNVVNFCARSPILSGSAKLIADDAGKERIDFDKTRLLIVVAGLGGRHTHKHLKKLAELAQKNNTPLAALLIHPFTFEGTKRLANAESQHEKLNPLLAWQTTYYNSNYEVESSKQFTLLELFNKTNQDIFETVSALVTVVGNASEPDEVKQKLKIICKFPTKK